MRDLRLLESYRDRKAALAVYGYPGDETCGVFVVPSRIDRAKMTIVASCGDGWDHVSVSRMNRCPNWAEMEHIKRMFFEPDETVMQLHVPVSEHLNAHPYCLHLWRPQREAIPRPPSWMVFGAGAPKP